VSDPEPQLSDLHLERLVLIVDSLEAQRMIATWNMAWERFADELISFDDVGEKLTEGFRESWSRVANVDIDDLNTLVPVLFDNDLLGSEGKVAPEALRYIQARMLDALQKPPR
jgi:hypothetical protein